MAVFVQIAGLPQVGAVFTANPTADSGELYQSIQWYSNTVESTTGGSQIAGATALTFTSTAAQAGKWIYAEGTFDDSGPLTALSNIIGPIGQGGTSKSKSKRAKAQTVEVAPPVPRPIRRIIKVDTTNWHPDRKPR